MGRLHWETSQGAQLTVPTSFQQVQETRRLAGGPPGRFAPSQEFRPWKEVNLAALLCARTSQTTGKHLEMPSVEETEGDATSDHSGQSMVRQRSADAIFP